MTNPADFDPELFQKGLQIRRDVLGSEHVDRSTAAADDFTEPMQKLLTEWCWGEIWSRLGLPRETRSLMNTALNLPHEVKLRGALNNGMTREEIQEVLMQVAIYCGVPVALDSMRVCVETFGEIDATMATVE